MATDYGFLNSMAQGIKEGMAAYQTVQKSKRDEKMMGLLQGVQYDPETGTAQYTPEKQAELAQAKQLKDLQISKAEKDLTSGKEEEDRLLDRQLKLAQIGKLSSEAKGLIGTGDEINFKRLPKDKQVGIEQLSGSKAKTEAIKSQMDALITQLDDPNIDSGQKLQIANNAAKLINSPLGADAVGAEEAKRVLAYLESAPQLFGPKGLKVGPDIEGFTKAMKLNSERLGTSNEALQGQVDSLYGRKGLIKKAAPAKPQTKIIDGVTLVKVPGGWEEQ